MVSVLNLKCKKYKKNIYNRFLDCKYHYQDSSLGLQYNYEPVETAIHLENRKISSTSLKHAEIIMVGQRIVSRDSRQYNMYMSFLASFSKSAVQYLTYMADQVSL